jgi:Nucleotide modification associated domain 3
MRIILSRKGVDSGKEAGHLPSPILNNTLISLPIPGSSQITYADLSFRGLSFGTLVEDLSDGCLRRTRSVHLDPDLRRNTYPRKPGWRPIFGQGNPQARAHLQRCGVTVGDLFLFYGWFREAERHDGKYRYKSDAPDIHVIYGWLQVGLVVSCNDLRLSDITWARYHDHFRWHDGTAYIASETLHLGYDLEGIAGAGHFTHYSGRLRLTAPGSERRGLWQMPGWFRPRNGCFPITYHRDRTRFSRRGNKTIVRSAARGQEFVLDSREYREAIAWARRLLVKGSNVS